MAWNRVPPEINCGSPQSEHPYEPEPSLPRTVTVIDLDDDGHVIEIPATLVRNR